LWYACLKVKCLFKLYSLLTDTNSLHSKHTVKPLFRIK
jgi:hypothetical protein